MKLSTTHIVVLVDDEGLQDIEGCSVLGLQLKYDVISGLITHINSDSGTNFFVDTRIDVGTRVWFDRARGKSMNVGDVEHLVVKISELIAVE